MILTIVTALYQSETHLIEFYNRICKAASDLYNNEFEIILVNDGSPDGSLEKAKKIADRDKRVKVIDLSRNFGHHKAIMTGLSYAQGELIFLIDSDLEEKPEWLLEFHRKMKENNSDVVFGFQEKRRKNKIDRIIGNTYYKVLKFFTDFDLPSNFVTARLMSRRYVTALMLHKENEINIGGLWYITGFEQISIPISKINSSPTTYTLRRKISHAINSITSFSAKPLYFIFIMGVLVFLSSLIFTGFVLFFYFTDLKAPVGYLSVITSIWTFSGLLIIMIGVQAIYIGKIFSEVKQRPATIIKEVYQGGNNGEIT
jgi:putative glycosyltransferase